MFSGFDTLVLGTEAESDYSVYVFEITRIFIRYSIKTEAELMLALPREGSNNNDSSSYDGSINIALCAAWKALQSSFRLRVDHYRDDTVEKRMCRASAWYHVDYEDKIYIYIYIFHSFCNSKDDLQTNGAIHVEVAAAIDMSALKVWNDGKVLLLNAVRCKQDTFNRVCNSI